MENQEIEKYINDLDRRLDKLSTSIAIIHNNIDKQGEVINKLSTSFEKLTVLVERTNENDKKITALFNQVERMNEKGTKNCPISINRISVLENKVDKLNNYIITAMITFLMQFISVVVYLIDKHLK